MKMTIIPQLVVRMGLYLKVQFSFSLEKAENIFAKYKKDEKTSSDMKKTSQSPSPLPSDNFQNRKKILLDI